MRSVRYIVRLGVIAAALVLGGAPAALSAQVVEPGALRTGQSVEVEYTPGSARWLLATVTDVVNDGYAYRVRIAANQGAAEAEPVIHFRRVRAATRATAPTAAPAASPAAPAPANRQPAGRVTLAPGRYGCTESRHDASSGGYVSDARGSVVLQAGGGYQYLGFAKPSTGTYRARAATGVLDFRGGHLAGGEATPIVDQPGRFYLTAPRTGARWTCGRSATR